MDAVDELDANKLKLAKQLLAKGKFIAAIGQLKEALNQSPEDKEALYVLAVCYRYNNDSQPALATLGKLLELYPEHARAYQERGHLHSKRAQSATALKAYEQAVKLNPALLVSWQRLSALYREMGEDKHSARCQGYAESLQELAPELLSVTSMIYQGEFYQAEQLCRAFLQKNRQHVVAMRLLAKIATELEILDEADFLLESCLEFSPDFHAARYDYSQVLYKRQRYQKSMQQLDLLLTQQPAHPGFRLAWANAAVPMGEFDRAIAYYDQLIAENPDNFNFHVLKGHALKSLGERQSAVESYKDAARLKPDHGDAWWSLANVKTYRFAADEIAAMQRAEADEATGNTDQCQLCFALGKSFEDSSDYEPAFNYYARGNDLKLKESGYRAELTEAEFDQQMALCTKEFFSEKLACGASSNEPIFIVGLPRSGSTLLEQILASHPMVDGTIELPNILSLVQKLGGRHKINEASRYPAILESMDQNKFEHFAEEYLNSTRVYRQGADFFTDKMPNNFRHIGLLQLIFPHAKIIDARRHPLACCFSNFKQLFGQGQFFSYGLREIGLYYRGYVKLMDHWETVLPGKILRVQYEDIIVDLESQVRRLLDFLGLPFDQSCIEFHKNRRAVHTPSAEQVRQPLYTSGLEQWKNFEPYLGPLKDSLGIV